MRELVTMVDPETMEEFTTLIKVREKMTDKQYEELCMRREKRTEYFLNKISEREVI